MTDSATMVFLVTRARKLRHATEHYHNPDLTKVGVAWVKRALALCERMGWWDAESDIECMWYGHIRPRQRRYSELFGVKASR